MNNLKNPLNLYQQGTGNGNCNLYMTIDEPYDKKDGEYVSKEVAQGLLNALQELVDACEEEGVVEVAGEVYTAKEAIKKATNEQQ